MKKIILAFVFGALLTPLFAQKVAIKTNLIYLATSTPNIGLEVGAGKKLTLGASFGYNPWNFGAEKMSTEHWLVQPEVRFWPCKKFERLFLGVHGLYSKFNISDDIPFANKTEYFVYNGKTYGGGLTLGYHWALGKRWGIEGAIGAGFARFDYNKYDCRDCDESLGYYVRDYFGPTKASLSIVYFIK